MSLGGSSFNRDPEGSASRITQHCLDALPHPQAGTRSRLNGSGQTKPRVVYLLIPTEAAASFSWLSRKLDPAKRTGTRTSEGNRISVLADYSVVVRSSCVVFVE